MQESPKEKKGSTIHTGRSPQRKRTPGPLTLLMSKQAFGSILSLIITQNMNTY